MCNNYFSRIVYLFLFLLISCQALPVEIQEPLITEQPLEVREPTKTPQPAATVKPKPTHTPIAEATERVDGWQLNEEFVLERGETAVVGNSDLIIRNEGEGSEYYDDENGNEVHVYNIKLDVNGEIVWLDDTMPEIVVGNYVIQWQVGNRLLVVAHEADE